VSVAMAFAGVDVDSEVAVKFAKEHSAEAVMRDCGMPSHEVWSADFLDEQAFRAIDCEAEVLWCSVGFVARMTNVLELAQLEAARRLERQRKCVEALAEKARNP
jgi:hypothetical protein